MNARPIRMRDLHFSEGLFENRFGNSYVGVMLCTVFATS